MIIEATYVCLKGNIKALICFSFTVLPTFIPDNIYPLSLAEGQVGKLEAVSVTRGEKLHQAGDTFKTFIQALSLLHSPPLPLHQLQHREVVG